MSDLLVSSLTPTLTSGTGLRTYGVIAALSREHPVEVAHVVFAADAPAPEYAQMERVTMRPLHASRDLQRAVEFGRGVVRGIPLGVARGLSPALTRVLDGVPADVRVIADGPVAAAALLPHARRREIAYLAHNVESSGFRGKSGRAALERFERRVFRSFAECWMATRADERRARAIAGQGIRTRYVPNVVDVTRIKPVAPAGAERLLFVGDFAYDPNLEALSFLAEQVLPILWERKPDVRLMAVGSSLPDVPRDQRIETPGFVEHLASAYGASDVVVVPLLRGGGSPLKFIEGLAYGLPVVATDHAAGLIEDGLPGRDFLVADDARAFAAAIEDLVSDPVRAGRIGSAGRELVTRSYSIQRLADLLGS